MGRDTVTLRGNPCELVIVSSPFASKTIEIMSFFLFLSGHILTNSVRLAAPLISWGRDKIKSVLGDSSFFHSAEAENVLTKTAKDANAKKFFIYDRSVKLAARPAKLHPSPPNH